MYTDNPNKKTGTLLEMKMGGGKTSVLLPLLANKIIKSSHLNIIVMPETLIPSVSSELSQILEQSFDLFVDVIVVDRKKLRKTENIKILRQRLEWDYNQKRMILISNSSIQSLFLAYIENMKAGIQENIDEFTGIFKLFKEKSIVTIDEADQVLDIMKSLRFTSGETLPIDNNIIYATYMLYIGIVQTPTLKNLLINPAFTDEEYQNSTKELIVDAFIKNISDINSNHFRFLFGSNDYNELASYDRKAVKEALLTQNQETLTQFISLIKNKNIQTFFSTAYKQIHSILPLTLRKIHGVNYALYPDEGCAPHNQGCPKIIAIPYHNGKPMIKSRFGSILESLNYTLQAILLEKKTIHPLLSLMKKTKSFKIYKDQNSEFLQYINFLIPESDIAPLISSISLEDNEASPEIINYAKNNINKNLTKVLLVTKNIINDAIQQSPSQLKTNAYIYPLLFNKIQGITGRVKVSN
ncbi:DUF3638 domain-containing protein [Endozoicomonas sp. Mp262]|uniref:DUF3638 domain-containing protein n=1 Tax=Endozoicomonas sp. Mp262 TaxID=2919499 RepID=UPI0021E08616